jgi:hypothetical protein
LEPSAGPTNEPSATFAPSSSSKKGGKKGKGGGKGKSCISTPGDDACDDEIVNCVVDSDCAADPQKNTCIQGICVDLGEVPCIAVIDEDDSYDDTEEANE